MKTTAERKAEYTAALMDIEQKMAAAQKFLTEAEVHRRRVEGMLEVLTVIEADEAAAKAAWDAAAMQDESIEGP